MANIIRIRSVWQGAAVIGPGVSTLYWDEADSGFVAKLNTFWTSLAAWIPTGIVITTQGSGDLLDVASGTLSGTWTDGGTSTVATTGAGVFSQGVGVRASWLTSGIRNGRRVRGSTFIVPIIGAAYATDGTPAGASMTAFNNAAQALVTAAASHMRVYSRPSAAGAGQQNTVISSNVSDAVSWLRTRRT